MTSSRIALTLSAIASPISELSNTPGHMIGAFPLALLPPGVRVVLAW